MKILVLGGSGLVGDAFIHNTKSYELITTYGKSKIENNNISSVKINLPQYWIKLKDLILKEKPEIVLNTIAYSNVDFCEINKKEVYDLHVGITEKITSLCSQINSKVIFLSTDYVFDGEKGNYSEEDKTNPVNYYGKTKDLAEKITLKDENNLVLRTSMIYGASPKVRFLRYVIENLTKEKEIETYDDIFNSATLLDELIDGILKAVKKDVNGVFHMVGSSCVSRYEFAKIVAKIFNFNENLIKPVSVNSVNLNALRPKNPCLNNFKATKICDCEFSTIEEGIKQVYNKKNNLQIQGI